MINTKINNLFIYYAENIFDENCRSEFVSEYSNIVLNFSEWMDNLSDKELLNEMGLNYEYNSRIGLLAKGIRERVDRKFYNYFDLKKYMELPNV